jgi:hypothetical protein
MAELRSIEDIIAQKNEELGEDHNAKAAKAFTDQALSLMEQNYILLNSVCEDDLPKEDANEGVVSFHVTVHTPDEQDAGDRSRRSVHGTKVLVNLQDMAKRAAELQGVTQKRYAYVQAIHVEHVANATDSKVMLEAEVNGHPVGLHYEGVPVQPGYTNETTPPSLCVASAQQRTHFSNEGRLVYGYTGGRASVDARQVAKYADIIGVNAIRELSGQAVGSHTIEYTSPTAKWRADEGKAETLVTGDQFVNLVYQNPGLFSANFCGCPDPTKCPHKVGSVDAIGADGNRMVNLRFWQEDFEKVHGVVQEMVLNKLREHVIDMRNPKPIVFRILPTDRPNVADMDDIAQAANKANLDTGAAWWATNALRKEKRPVSFDVRVTMKYV